ncbi:hypothetical protein NC651_016349 [Populus alba x Populus x berolinensis]|nr:hypothetical protein NC651_016349 [Populus alba x Populus x berolinensis]
MLPKQSPSLVNSNHHSTAPKSLLPTLINHNSPSSSYPQPYPT